MTVKGGWVVGEMIGGVDWEGNHEGCPYGVGSVLRIPAFAGMTVKGGWVVGEMIGGVDWEGNREGCPYGVGVSGDGVQW